ncbi:DUF1534 domain-containing protein [Pseudomonas syringae]|nr:DUF1534 domain-containing protein [Pseudomonas syringae]PYD16023.1 hypothetical protein DND47_11650 [Pseudomonas syringae pv. syringae]MCF5201307.1 DUF1534 domain-containing protein [Pseudomonas syringae]MCF5268935.1 DUF1534 domain-containing protein [Pseudomonas syringae]MCF5277080.1 DUF1534 domain-containing protein [Pseudomonas syringae]
MGEGASRADAERPELRANAEHWHGSHCRAGERSVSFRHLSLRTLQRGNAVLDALRHLLPRGISRSSSGSHCHPPPQC